MDHGVGIAGLSEIIGVLAVTISVGAAAFFVERIKRPKQARRR